MPSSGVKKLTLDDMRFLANKNGGKCLSKEYITSTTRLEWQCDKGHIWKALPKDIKRSHWCPICGGSSKLTIEEMKNIAK